MKTLPMLALALAGCAPLLPPPPTGPAIPVYAGADDALAAALQTGAPRPLRASAVAELETTSDCALAPAFVGLNRVTCVRDRVGNLGWVVRDDLVQVLPRSLAPPTARPNSPAASSKAAP